MSGRLAVVGIGPGGPECLTPQALAALETSGTLVGYTRYLELLPPELLAGREVVSTGMTGEVERCNAALDRAQAGERVAVVSSGDAGVYGMAGLVLELAEARGALADVDIEMVPGIPAVVAAAAILGAPLMHDFACISLSDLLTPWGRIEERLDAAARADFVIALYNPRSRRRAGQLPRALEIIGAHRAPGTPLGLVRQAHRPDQSALVTTLGAFDPAAADMLSICIVGNSATRMVAPAAAPGPGAPRAARLLTPRGYAGKYDLTPSQTPRG
ncbi:MAG: precorrin-3B C(17)-methyltransferase [Desulfovibrionaceae bacterium]|nr:precorrin-3B C(17)-methyltransferase [Desulfovibrionaceae bacterium]